MKIARMLCVSLLRAALLTVVLTVTVDHSAPAMSIEHGPDQPQVVQTLAARYRCGTLPAGVIPAHALVEDEDGVVRITSFDEGWRIYTADSPDSVLLAVCLR